MSMMIGARRQQVNSPAKTATVSCSNNNPNAQQPQQPVLQNTEQYPSYPPPPVDEVPLPTLPPPPVDSAPMPTSTQVYPIPQKYSQPPQSQPQQQPQPQPTAQLSSSPKQTPPAPVQPAPKPNVPNSPSTSGAQLLLKVIIKDVDVEVVNVKRFFRSMTVKEAIEQCKHSMNPGLAIHSVLH